MSKAGLPGFLFCLDDICGLLLDFPGFKIRGQTRMVKFPREEGRSSAVRGGNWGRYLRKGGGRDLCVGCFLWALGSLPIT